MRRRRCCSSEFLSAPFVNQVLPRHRSTDIFNIKCEKKNVQTSHRLIYLFPSTLFPRRTSVVAAATTTTTGRRATRSDRKKTPTFRHKSLARVRWLEIYNRAIIYTHISVQKRCWRCLLCRLASWPHWIVKMSNGRVAEDSHTRKKRKKKIQKRPVARGRNLLVEISGCGGGGVSRIIW